MFLKVILFTILSFTVYAQNDLESYKISYVQDLPSEFKVFDHTRSREVYLNSFEIPWFHGNYKQESCSISYGETQRGGRHSGTSCESLKTVLNDFIKKYNLTRDNFIQVNTEDGGYKYKTDKPLIIETNFVGTTVGLNEVAFYLKHPHYKNQFTAEKAIARIARVLSAMRNPRFDDVYPSQMRDIVEELYNDEDFLDKVNHHPNFKRGLYDDLLLRVATKEEIEKHGNYVLGRAQYFVLGTDDDVDRFIIFGPYQEPFSVYYPNMDDEDEDED